MQATLSALKAAVDKSAEAATEATAAARAATTAANGATAAANGTTAALQQVTREQRALRRDFGVLWRRVHGTGSDAPPPPQGDPDRAPTETHGEPGVLEQLDGLNESDSRLGLEMAALEGRMIGALASVKRDVMDELTKQSSDMGIGRSLLKTKQGRVLVVTVVTLVLTSIGQIVGALRSSAPLPATASAPTVIYVPAASPGAVRNDQGPLVAPSASAR